MSFAEITAKADRLLRVMLVPGPGTTLQAVPFQCSIRMFEVPVGAIPTAQTSLAETAATALKTLSVELGFGLGMTDQVEPFQCSMSDCERVNAVL